MPLGHWAPHRRHRTAKPSAVGEFRGFASSRPARPLAALRRFRGGAQTPRTAKKPSGVAKRGGPHIEVFYGSKKQEDKVPIHDGGFWPNTVHNDQPSSPLAWCCMTLHGGDIGWHSSQAVSIRQRSATGCKGPGLDAARPWLSSGHGWMDVTLIPGFPLRPIFGRGQRGVECRLSSVAVPRRCYLSGCHSRSLPGLPSKTGRQTAWICARTQPTTSTIQAAELTPAGCTSQSIVFPYVYEY